MRFLTPQQVEDLAAAIQERFRALVLTAAYTGARFGELAPVRAERVDLLRRTLRLEETFGEVRGRIVLGPTKTRASRRTVSLPRALVGVLDEHIATHGPGRDELVFTAPAVAPFVTTAGGGLDEAAADALDDVFAAAHAGPLRDGDGTKVVDTTVRTAESSPYACGFSGGGEGS